VTEAPKPENGDAPSPPAPKLDPEALALRAQPARAIRFRRGVIIGIAAIASVGVVSTAWLALQPSTLQFAGQPNDDTSLAAKPPTDTLAPLPSSYGDVPKLGPALPGDLGRPILRQQQQAMAIQPNSNPPPMADRFASEERDRKAAERKAALQSAILVRSSGSTAQGPSDVAASPTGPAIDGATHLAIDPLRDPNAQQRKADFLASSAPAGTSAHRLEAAASPYMLSAGSVIAASLITGLRSDLPGLVTAQVTERVFDSATGQTLLIPQGARLIGSYDSVVAFGQRRALIVWQRLILPNGSSLQIDNVPAADPSGFAGLTDQVDFHTWTLLKGAAISTLLGVGSNLTFSGESDLVQAIRESTQQNASRAGDQLVSRNLSVQPTITVRPGASVRLIVHRDLILQPWRE
jgi:type IV secretion system protein VirB10